MERWFCPQARADRMEFVSADDLNKEVVEPKEDSLRRMNEVRV
jgi:hypothetical protein